MKNDGRILTHFFNETTFGGFFGPFLMAKFIVD